MQDLEFQQATSLKIIHREADQKAPSRNRSYHSRRQQQLPASPKIRGVRRVARSPSPSQLSPASSPYPPSSPRVMDFNFIPAPFVYDDDAERALDNQPFAQPLLLEVEDVDNAKGGRTNSPAKHEMEERKKAPTSPSNPWQDPSVLQMTVLPRGKGDDETHESELVQKNLIESPLLESQRSNASPTKDCALEEIPKVKPQPSIDRQTRTEQNNKSRPKSPFAPLRRKQRSKSPLLRNLRLTLSKSKGQQC